jgi:type III secretion protein Q
MNIELSIGGLPAQLELPRALLEMLLSAVPGERGMDGSEAALLLELALLPSIEAIERILDGAIRLLEIRTGPTSPAQHLLLGARLDLGAGAFPLRLAVPLEAVPFLERVLGPMATGAGLEETLSCVLSCEIGRTPITRRDLQSLLLGDVILPSEPIRLPLEATLTLAERWIVPASLSDRNLTLESGLRCRPAHEEESMMSHDDAQDEVLSLDDLPVRLVFEAGRIEMPFSELNALAPGQVLILPGSAEAPIGIFANGRRIGAGELVRVGERIGMRVIGLTAHG